MSDKVENKNGKDFDEDAFCKVLIAAINDTRNEMDRSFAAGLVR